MYFQDENSQPILITTHHEDESVSSYLKLKTNLKRAVFTVSLSTYSHLTFIIESNIAGSKRIFDDDTFKNVLDEQKKKQNQTSIVENEKVKGFVEKFVGLTIPIAEKLTKYDDPKDADEEEKNVVGIGTYINKIGGIIAYLILIAFTLYSLLNKRIDYEGYFMNTSLMNILTVNNTAKWKSKSHVFPDLIERFSPFFLDDIGNPKDLANALRFVSNVDVNFVRSY